METYTPYPCKQCGCCCRHVQVLEEMRPFDRGDGVCKHLRTDNKCDIYDHRPDLCNGKYVYEHFFPQMTVKEFHQLLAVLCEKLRKSEGITI